MNWLLLRGLVREQRHWREFKNIFAQKTGARIYTLDHPGIGTEVGTDCPSTVSAIMRDDRERFTHLRKVVLDQTGDSDWALCSISLGSMVALQWAAEYSNDFSKIVITNTSAKPLCTTFERFIPKNILNLPKFFFNKNKFKRERTILEMTANMHSKSSLDEIASEYAQFALEHDKFKKTGLAQLVAGSCFVIPETLYHSHGKQNSWLVLNSRNDRLVHTNCSQKIAEFLNAPIYFHEKAGHDLSLDDPQWMADTIIKNLK